MDKITFGTADSFSTDLPYEMTGKELMVVKDKAVDERVRQLFPNLKPSRSRSSQVITSAYRQGQVTAGMSVSTNLSAVPLVQ